MIFESLYKAHGLIRTFNKLVLENMDCDQSTGLKNGVWAKVYQEYYLSTLTSYSMCLQERDDSLFAIAKGKENDYTKVYNDRFRNLIYLGNLYFNRFIALAGTKIPEDLEYHFYDDKVIIEIIEMKKNIFQELYSQYNHKPEFKGTFDILANLFSQIQMVQRDIVTDFHIESLTPVDKLFHRDNALILHYKIEAGYEKTPFKADLIKDRGIQFYNKGWRTIFSKKGSDYREPKTEELEKIIPYLKDFPKAEALAVKAYSNLI